MTNDEKAVFELYDVIKFLVDTYKADKRKDWVEDAKSHALYTTWKHFDELRMARRQQDATNR